MKKNILLVVIGSLVMALFMGFNLSNIIKIPKGALIYEKTFLSDGEEYRLDAQKIWTDGQHVSNSLFGIKRTDLPNTPVVIRSFENSPYDFEFLQAYSIYHLSPFVIKSDYLYTFDEPYGFIHFNKDELINNLSPVVNKEEFKYYLSRFNLEFFHTLMQSKIGRTALSKYCIDAFNSLQYNLPVSLKQDLKNEVASLKDFVKMFPSRKSELMRIEKNSCLMCEVSNWEGFIYRRIINDGVPIAEIAAFLDEIEKSIDIGNSNHLKLIQVDINNGDFIISDTTNNGIVLSTNNTTKRIVIPRALDSFIQIKMYRENDKNYYQFQGEYHSSTKFLGLYSSEMETIRPPE